MNSLPEKLQQLVFWATKTLGHSIKSQYGEETFKLVEHSRKKMKSIRSSEHQKAYKVLLATQKSYRNLSDQQLKDIAHSFSLMLELINRCESAYRYFRLQGRVRTHFEQHPYAVIFVFTAHPTEARSPQILQIYHEIHLLLITALNKGYDEVQERLRFYLDLALNVSMARSVRPTVEDEASHLYSYILRDEILNRQIKFAKEGINVNFRSWVGGDKDGHPGVNEKTLLMSLTYSRNRLIEWLNQRLEKTAREMSYLENLPKGHGDLVKEILKDAKLLRVIRAQDGAQVVRFKKKIKDLAQSLKKHGVDFPDLGDIQTMLWIYPALVLPLEIREDAQLVHEALKDKKLAIAKMLEKTCSISEGLKAKWYIRGFVISMCESAQDIKAGLELVKQVLGVYSLPVVPLFETAHALENSSKILDTYFRANSAIKSAHVKQMNGRFEVMLGYSDSSKESGVFPSRYLISKALRNMDRFFSKEKLVPVFFHGSGGSIERGGGSIREQTEWWPRSAVNIFKATTQGEMIARNFQSDMIMTSQVDKIVEQLNYKEHRHDNQDSSFLDMFAKKIQSKYQSLIEEETFREQILNSTPYSYLDALKIGSRPAKRQSEGQRLRAIPWVLCWTQVRVLMPTWWGVGSAFGEMNDAQKDELKSLFRKNKLVSSYFKLLGFTLRKVELAIFELYLQANNSQEETRKIMRRFELEFALTLKCFHWVTGESELLWFRPWLSQSIYYRSSMIHPLNLIQLEALRRKDEELLRETVTGIACGMLTTG